MVAGDSPRRGPAPREANEEQQVNRHAAQPWEYERHLQAEHNLLVEAEKGWPTTVKRYRLFRPSEKNRRERTLLAVTGTGPEALAKFYRYIHPEGPSQSRARMAAPRPR
jgi:hypothetical protein